MRSLAFLLLAISCVLAQDVVPTQQGPVRGVVYADKRFRVFRGIPYAQSTAGSLRWTRPQPMANWQGTLDATKFRPACPQRDPDHRLVVPQDEDCLNLNVWTPLPQKDGSNAAWPVMVWTHGGGFTSGTGSDPIFSGDFMANRTNTVLVTLNYRLGALGFLNIKQDGQVLLEGNYGFMDQQAALRWVQQNIAAFGGDPKQVTLFGQSAGAMSVTCHLLSPASYGLYSRVIIQSNPAALLYRSPEENLEYAKRFADNVKCGLADLDCLRKIDVPTIVFMQIFPEMIIRIPLHSTMVLPWSPNVDGTVLPAQPLDMFRAGKYNHVPIVLGNVKNETGQKIPMNELAYSAFVLSIWPQNATQVFGMYPASKDSTRQAFQALTDYIFICPTRYLASLIVKQQPNVWLYEFLHGPNRDPISYSDPLCNNQQLACHSAELPYIFNTPTFYNASFTQDEQGMSDSMNRYWTTFASGTWRADGYLQTGDKNDPAWPAYDLKTRPALDLDLYRTILGNWRGYWCDFWDTVGYTI